MDELEQLMERLRYAEAVRDDARLVSQRYLDEKRAAIEALKFARRWIKACDEWTTECEMIIGAVLK